MSIPCEKSGCTSACEQLLRSENQELRDKIKMLQNTFDSESDKKSSTSSTEEKVNEIFVKQTKSDLESSQEHIKRLKEDYDEAMKKNQELENRILQMAEELQLEKSRFEETVGSMSEQLMNFVEKMNKMERECIQNKRDCSLVVQLLKCNQSLDKKFVSQKVKTMPSDLQEKLTLELNITPESKPLNHPARSRKLWRTKSASSASTSSPSELSDAE
ncbi:brain-enriched guanylate kinase-associated protein-like [Montipora capricornis]|uniref:brain-enriched guanylate kinase-associated protein-like n=1 Tax=Montipora capricornis TaxID=246305 RepID=UPI0035F21734